MLFLLPGENKYSHCCRNSDGPWLVVFMDALPEPWEAEGVARWKTAGS